VLDTEGNFLQFSVFVADICTVLTALR